MAIKLSKENFKEVDSAFVDILDGKNVSQNLDKIGDILSKTFDKRFTVSIIKPKRNDPFYIMSIFPEQSTIDRLVDSILNEESDKKLKEIWDDNHNWTIEIDNRIITGSFVDANSKEMTALLLHECGHVIASNSIPQRMSKIMRYEYAKANLGTKNTLRQGLFKKVLEIPILKTCIFENYKTDAALKKELKADLFAVKMGYGDELNSVLTKILTVSSANKPTGGHIDIPSDKVYDQMKSDTLFSINLVEDLQKRQAEVSKKNFEKMLLNLPGEYIKKATKSIYDAMFAASNGKTETMKENALMESANYYYEEAYTKEAFDIFKKKMKRIDPSIPDYVEIRKGDIRSNDDKLMLVSYIYSKIDLINYYLDIMNNPKFEKRYVFYNTKQELLRMKAQLEKDKEEILQYRIPEINYGIQVNYPDGYTG